MDLYIGDIDKQKKQKKKICRFLHLDGVLHWFPGIKPTLLS